MTSVHETQPAAGPSAPAGYACLPILDGLEQNIFIAHTPFIILRTYNQSTKTLL